MKVKKCEDCGKKLSKIKYRRCRACDNRSRKKPKNKEEERERSRKSSLGYYYRHQKEGQKRSLDYYHNHRDKRKDYHKEWVKKNPERNLKNQQKWAEKNQERWIALIEEFIGGKIECQRCGYSKYFRNIDFHHRNPGEKKKGVSKIIWGRKPTSQRIEVLKEELKKCDILCNRCHGEVHEEWKEKIYGQKS